MAMITAETAYGCVRGVPSEKNPLCSVFRGIPYAQPPVGTLRFAPPQPVIRWEGERVCDHFSAACIQSPHPDEYSYAYSEDCLYLNVYTPAKTTDDSFPVLFWIHGGAFSRGSSGNPEFDGSRLCALGAVVVTINYRCGALGFFCLPELGSVYGPCANYGILDQIAALRWVRENIASFGGDPDRVTIFGQSAGGMSVRILLTSPLAKGLFSRAIIQSGGGLNEGDLVRSRDEFTALCRSAMDEAGVTVQDLRSCEAGKLAALLADAAAKSSPVFEVAYFQPFVDGVTLTDIPGKCIAAGRYAQVPIICGTVAGDSWMFSRKVRKQLEGCEDYMRAFSFAAGEAWAQHNARCGRAPIQTYYFDRKQPKRGSASGFHGQGASFGADTPHSAEIAYVFGTLDVRSDRFTPYDRELSSVMGRYWVNFAATGDPNGGGLPPWPSHTEETPFAMYFGDEGYGARDLLQSAREQKILDYTIEHPGMLESLDGLNLEIRTD